MHWYIRVFISYRREQTLAFAECLYWNLVTAFGKDNIFLDKRSIKPGRLFPSSIDTAIRNSNVILFLIDPHWLDTLIARSKLEEKDYVLAELTAAVDHYLNASENDDVYLLPILLNGAQMPAPKDFPSNVPDSVRQIFPQINGLELNVNLQGQDKPTRLYQRAAARKQNQQAAQEIVDVIQALMATRQPVETEPPEPSIPVKAPVTKSRSLTWLQNTVLALMIVLMILGVSLLSLFSSQISLDDFKYKMEQARWNRADLPIIAVPICDKLPIACKFSEAAGNEINALNLPVKFGPATLLSMYLGIIALWLLTLVRQLHGYLQQPGLLFGITIPVSVLIFASYDYVLGINFLFLIGLALVMITIPDFKEFEFAGLILSALLLVWTFSVEQAGYTLPNIAKALFAGSFMGLFWHMITDDKFQAVVFAIIVGLVFYMGGPGSVSGLLQAALTSLSP